MTEFNIPFEPTYLMPNNITCSENIEYIFETINNFLLSYGSIRFEFSHNRWYILYYRGTNLCKMEINVFRKHNSTDYVIEFNRLFGEAYVFLWIRSKITNIFIPDSYPDRSEDDINPFAPPPLPDEFQVELSYEDSYNAVQPIIDMANSEHIYEKKMAAKLLCEMSYENDIKHYLPSFGCIEVLMDLLQYRDTEIMLYCLEAISNLANNQEDIDIINNHIHSNVFEEFSMMINVPFVNYSCERAHIKRFTDIIIRRCKHKDMCLKYRNQFRNWLWERVRRPRIEEQYHPDKLRDAVNLLGEDADIEDLIEEAGW